MVVNGETLAPWGKLASDNYKSSKKYDNQVLAKQHGLWAIEGTTVVSATAGESRAEGGRKWLELTNMRLYEFEVNGRLKSITYAARAQHEGDTWTMQDTVRIDFSQDKVVRTTAATHSWKSTLDEAALASSIVRADALTARDLSKNIEYRKRNSLETAEFEDTYWSRWFYPLNVLALCLAAIPFAFGTLRSGGFGKRLFLGIIFALGFWMLQTQSVKLASVFHVDFRLAYLLPLILMLLISWILFKRKPAS
jgi:lipopolysaccharide export system permease protein